MATLEQIIKDLQEIADSGTTGGNSAARRKAAEEALIQSQELYHALFEASPDAMFLVDPETGRRIRMLEKTRTIKDIEATGAFDVPVLYSPTDEEEQVEGE